jgi:hypothetical protein
MGGYPVLPTPFVEEVILSPMYILGSLSEIKWLLLYEHVSGSSILFYLSSYLLFLLLILLLFGWLVFCQYHVIFITIVL